MSNGIHTEGNLIQDLEDQLESCLRMKMKMTERWKSSERGKLPLRVRTYITGMISIP